MASLGINFDANQVAPQTEMGVVPAGWYNVTITKSEMKQNGKKNGSYLALEYTAIDGNFKGRKFFNNLNLNNPNATAVEIAQAELSSICHATNVLVIQDSNQLHNIPFSLKVGIEPEGKGDDGKNYPERNSVQGYKKLDGSVSVAQSPVGQTGNNTPAWANPAPATPASPPVVSAPVAPPMVQAPVQPPAPSGLQAAVLDGWQVHPTAPGYHWKGTEVIDDASLASRYPAQVPAIPQAPSAPVAPMATTPPWQAQGASASAPAQQAAELQQPSANTTTAPPPWQK